MKIKTYFFLGLFLITGGLAFTDGRDAGMEPADGFFLPKGNPEAGEKAFADLKCNACHWVQNNTNFKPPVALRVGPTLGKKQADYAPGWIANSIVSPSHTIAVNSGGQAEGSELSEMGDFTETMSLRQLIDVVAYIEALGDKEPAA